MGTLFFTDAMHPGDGRGEEGILRQVEIFRPSGEEYLTLRIGEPDEQHQGRGVSVQLTEVGARDLLLGLVAGMHYLGFKTDDLI